MLSTKRFHIFNNFKVECIECETGNSILFYLCIGCEKRHIFMCFPLMCGGPWMSVSALSVYQEHFFECAVFSVEWMCVVHCRIALCLNIANRNASRSEHTIQTWSKWLDLISNDSLHTRFPHFLHHFSIFQKKKMQREKHWLSTVWAHQHQFSIFSQYGFKFISLLFNVFNWDVIKRILQQ